MTSVNRDQALRILLALGDPVLERRLVDELPGEGVMVAGRCLDGPSLLEAASTDAVDMVLASGGLHGLTEGTLMALGERRVPVVLLVANAAETERFAALAAVVPTAATTAAVADVLRHGSEDIRLSHPVRPTRAEPLRDVASSSSGEDGGSVIAVVSGKGAPGKSTVAIALASAWSREQREVALVDGDLRGGNIAPYLNLDPRRGLVGLGASTGPLAESVAGELQPGPGFAVLCGLERLEFGAVVGADILAAAVATLRLEFGLVVVDAGVSAGPAVLRGADVVLLVTGADLVSLWNTRVALPGLSAAGARCAAVVNRREGREHYDQDEVERALGLPVLAVVREDRRKARRAIERHVSLTETGGRVAGDLRFLARALGDFMAPPLARSAAIGRVAVEA